MHGIIEGEIVVALNSRDVVVPGIECRVKQVFIKRELFGLDKKYHQGTPRITGSVNADFLPLISARNDFITDSPEYKLFQNVMRAELEKVLRDIKKQKDVKNIKKITKELQRIMEQVRSALMLNPDFVPQGRAVTRLKKEGRKNISAASADFSPAPSPSPAGAGDGSIAGDSPEPSSENSGKNKEKPEEKKIDVKPLALKRIRIKKLGISCGIVSLGEQGPEVAREGNAVYINQDHPVYQKLYKKQDLLHLHLLRLLSQEIVLMKKARISAQEAFDWQSKLLKDAMGGE